MKYLFSLSITVFGFIQLSLASEQSKIIFSGVWENTDISCSLITSYYSPHDELGTIHIESDKLSLMLPYAQLTPSRKPLLYKQEDYRKIDGHYSIINFGPLLHRGIYYEFIIGPYENSYTKGFNLYKKIFIGIILVKIKIKSELLSCIPVK